MATRTDAVAVQTVIDTDLTQTQVDAFIADASLWVTENLAPEGLGASLLTAIEKYLACHLITLRDPRVKEAALGDARERYQRDDKVTEYLKTAVALDPTGKVEQAFIVDEEGPAFQFRAGTGY